MSNYSREGLQRDLQSTDPVTHQNALRELARWMTAEDPLKREFAAKISAEAINKTVDTAEKSTNDKRKAEIFQTFFRAHPDLVNATANRNILENFLVSNYNSQLTLDTLELAVEQLSGSLAKQRVEATPLTPEQKLRAKLNAQKMRETWLLSLSTDELRGLAKQEGEDRKHGRDPLSDMRLTPEEQEVVKTQPKPSRTSVRLWVPNSDPKREFSSLELRQMSAPRIRALIGDGSGTRTDYEKLKRFNEILAGVTPEGA